MKRPLISQPILAESSISIVSYCTVGCSCVLDACECSDSLRGFRAVRRNLLLLQTLQYHIERETTSILDYVPADA